MTVAEVLSEYRRGPKTVTVERLHDGEGKLIAYRVMQVQRFSSLSEAKDDYLSTIPSSKQEYYRKELNRHKPKPKEAKHDTDNSKRA